MKGEREGGEKWDQTGVTVHIHGNVHQNPLCNEYALIKTFKKTCITTT
jgi:hypothetical protein